MFISNNRPWFYLWRKENLVKHQKVSKYYETDCSYKNYILPCFFLIRRKMLTQPYSFIINKITRSLNNFFCTESNVIIFPSLYICLSLSRGHHQTDRFLYPYNKLLKLKKLRSCQPAKYLENFFLH